VPTRELLSPAQRQAFATIPEPSARDLARCCTLSPEEVAIIERRRRPHNRLGFAVQLAFLRFLGRPLQPGEIAHPAIVAAVAAQFGLDPTIMADYARARDTTRREHLADLQRAFGFRPFDARAYRALAVWLLPTALMTDDGLVLVGAVIGELRARQVILPALSTIERLGWETRRRAQRQVSARLTDGLTADQRAQLDALLLPAQGQRLTPLALLRLPPGRRAPATVLALVARLNQIRAIGLDPAVAGSVHQTRLRRLARDGGRYTPQALQRFPAARRYAILVAFLLETGATLIDQILEQHDRLLGGYHAASQQAHRAQLQQRAPAMGAVVQHHATIGTALIAARAAQTDPYAAIEAVLPWPAFVAGVDRAQELARPADGDPLAALDACFTQLRRYAPTLLETLTFDGVAACQPLLDALAVLKAFNQTRRRRLPDDAPVGFVSPRWEPYVVTVAGLDRTYYELCALSELRDRLRAGDVWVAGSRQYRAFEDYLLADDAWQRLKDSATVPVAVTTDWATYLAAHRAELHEEMTTIAGQMSTGTLPDVRLEKGRLVITPFASGVPEAATATGRLAYAKLTFVKITELLMEVDELVDFGRCFTHAQTGRPPKDRHLLYTVLLAEGTNLGLEKMAQTCPGLSYAQLAHFFDWHVRDETYRHGLAEVINGQRMLPYAHHWGDGATASADGQHFPAGGRRESIGQVNARYGPQATLNFYGHLSGQYGPFYPTVISGTAFEAPYLFDGLLYHETDLQIEEVIADTGAFTDQIFGMAALLGYRFAPRIRDLPDKRLYAFEPADTYPVLAPLIGGRLNGRLIERHWDDLLRLTCSIRQGTVTASLILRKLAAYPRQNAVAQALRELGRIDRTLHLLRWFQEPPFRRHVGDELNKHELKNSLQRALFMHRLGTVQDRAFEDQRLRASGLNFLVAVISYWNTLYLDLSIQDLHREGVVVPEEHLPHLSPLDWEHIILTGEYRWEPDPLRRPGERRRLRPVGR